MVAPRNLCNRLLHRFGFFPCFRKRPHVLEISCRKALLLRESGPKVLAEVVDDRGPPAALCLLPENFTTNLPVEDDELAVDG